MEIVIYYRSSLDSAPLQGLKTGMYYLRTRPAADPIKFTLDKLSLKEKTGAKLSEAEEKERAKNEAAMMCSLENKDACVSCGS